MRWTARRKEQILKAIEAGEFEVFETNDLTIEELNEWQALYAEHGIKGLRATRSQIYRNQMAVSRDLIDIRMRLTTAVYALDRARRLAPSPLAAEIRALEHRIGEMIATLGRAEIVPLTDERWFKR